MDWLLVIVLILPAVATVVSLLVPTSRGLLVATLVSVLISAILDLVLAGTVLAGGATLTLFGGWLRLDSLSAFHLAVLALVFALSTIYAWTYFQVELAQNCFRPRQARQWSGLWLTALAAMQFTLCVDNLGLMWVGMESTTLATAFLVCLHRSRPSLEAMWKYVMICSVGIGLAFMGTLLFAAAAAKHTDATDALLWTRLSAMAGILDPTLAKAGFLFVLVGYGTKAGLAPMHTWLPDAHSQAPTPVSAIFSGFMLNTAFYCILRYLPIAEAATGDQGWALGLLRGFGLGSIAIAAIFVIFQQDLKRLLAYSTVEHLGIIALGVGLGGIGTVAALFHTLNHALAKTTAFFAAGRLGQVYGTHEMAALAGSAQQAPLWGGTMLIAILVLIGMAPFAVFISELQVAKAAVDGQHWISLVLYLAGIGVVFIAVLGHALPLAWSTPRSPRSPRRTTAQERCLAILPLVALLVLGLWMPAPLRRALDRAAEVIRSPTTCPMTTPVGDRP